MNTKLGVLVLAAVFGLGGTAFAHGICGTKAKTSMNMAPQSYTAISTQRVVGVADLPLRQLIKAKDKFLAGERFDSSALVRNVAGQLRFKAGAVGPETRHELYAEGYKSYDNYGVQYNVRSNT